MSLASDLLVQARVLCLIDSKKPKQANLRRAVSTAYYALFHLLIDDALNVLSPTAPQGLAHVMRRAFNHADMKAACKGFGSSNPQTQLHPLVSLPVPSDLAYVPPSGHRVRSQYCSLRVPEPWFTTHFLTGLPREISVGRALGFTRKCTLSEQY